MTSRETWEAENGLSVHAEFLEPLADALAERWCELYLVSFGRYAFFSKQRVEKIFKELTQLFISSLKGKNLDFYFENLQEKGRIFSSLGVPFEEVIISMHLFEETCTEQFLSSYPQRSKLPEMILAMEALQSEALSVLASSYFEASKEHLLKISESLKEENESLKAEASQLRESFFGSAKRDLSSMQLVISGLSQKLKNRASALSRVQKISESLENESDPERLMLIASNQLKHLLPRNSEVIFGWLDESKNKVNTYCQDAVDPRQVQMTASFFSSEFMNDFRELLFRPDARYAHFQDPRSIPLSVRQVLGIKPPWDFFVVPIRLYQESTGFIILAAGASDFFCKGTHKFFWRSCQSVSKALTTAKLFGVQKKQDEFEMILDRLKGEKHLQQPIETTLDFCLGSLIKLLGAERSSLMRYDESEKSLKVCAAKGYKVYPISGSSIRWGEGVAGLALKESKIISIARMHEPQTKNSSEIKVKSLLCVPLHDMSVPIGVVNISTINFYKNFDRAEVDMVQKIAARLSGLLKEF